MSVEDRTAIDKINVQGRLVDDEFVFNFRNLNESIRP